MHLGDGGFKKLLKEKQPDVEFVRSRRRRWQDRCGRGGAGLGRRQADAIFSSLFGADLAKFVREGASAALQGVEVFNLLPASPNISIREGRGAVGWYVTGYRERDQDGEHKKFLDAYQASSRLPAPGSVVGYRRCVAAAAIKKAGGLDQEKLVAAMATSLSARRSAGDYRARPSIDDGAYVGRIGLKTQGLHDGLALLDGKDRCERRRSRRSAGQLTA